jgi:2,4-dichlorophenol 6-monooxygenase
VISDGTPLIDERDAKLFYQPSTRPGAPLPHVWLAKRTPGPRVSTLDIAGKQRFVLFTGQSGEAWRESAASISRQIGVAIDTVAIGPFLDYEDIYGGWANVAAIEDGGCILVRPDSHIAWRSVSVGSNPEESLQKAMTQILGLSTARGSGNALSNLHQESAARGV